MTRQYIVGEFSSFVAELEEESGDLAYAARRLRREIESSGARRLPELAQEALNLADRVCSVALENGDTAGFRRHAETAAALGDFASSASLLP